MTGAHDHPEIAALDQAVAGLASRAATLATALADLEAQHRQLVTRITTLEGGTMGLDYRYLGKPSGTLTVSGAYVDLDMSRWDPPRDGWEHTIVYLNVTPVFKTGKTRGSLRVRLMRAGGDATNYMDHVIDADALIGGAQLITQTYWESGDSTASRIQLRTGGGLASAKIGTRYTKRALLS